MLLPILSCTDCGVCCYLQPIPPFMPNELDVLPVALRKQIEQAEDRAQGEPCIWLGLDKRCTQYEMRPEICRQFELAGDDCRETRAAFGL